jgi:hypothetical protein
VHACVRPAGIRWARAGLGPILLGVGFLDYLHLHKPIAVGLGNASANPIQLSPFVPLSQTHTHTDASSRSNTFITPITKSTKKISKSHFTPNLCHQIVIFVCV